MDPQLKKRIRRILLASACAALALSILIVHTSGGSAATDCLSRLAMLIMLALAFESSLDLARRVSDIWRDDDPAGTGQTTVQTYVQQNQALVQKEAGEVTRQMIGLIVLCLLAGFGFSAVLWHADVHRRLAYLLHAGPDTPYIITSSSDWITLTYIILSLAAAVIVFHIALLKIAEAHPFAWREARTTVDGGTTWLVVSAAVAGILCLVITGVAAESYTRITPDGVAVSRFPSTGESFYPWKSVSTITEYYYYHFVPRKGVGYNKKGPYWCFRIVFADNSCWKSTDIPDSKHESVIEAKLKPAMQYAAKQSGHKLEFSNLQDW